MRDDERFVAERVAESLDGQWAEGENPPDAHLRIGGREVALEISTLVQLVVGKSAGKHVSRQSQDAGALQLSDRLDAQLSPMFHGTRGVVITFFTPIRSFRHYETALRRELEKVIALERVPEDSIDVVSRGDTALITVHEGWRYGHKRIAGAVLNRRSSADILANARESLRERLASKAAWSFSRSQQEHWLALLNLYDILANADTYRQALLSTDVEHGFSRILLVSTSGKVDTIFLKEE